MKKKKNDILLRFNRKKPKHRAVLNKLNKIVARGDRSRNSEIIALLEEALSLRESACGTNPPFDKKGSNSATVRKADKIAVTAEAELSEICAEQGSESPDDEDIDSLIRKVIH